VHTSKTGPTAEARSKAAAVTVSRTGQAQLHDLEEALPRVRDKLVLSGQQLLRRQKLTPSSAKDSGSKSRLDARCSHTPSAMAALNVHAVIHAK